MKNQTEYWMYAEIISTLEAKLDEQLKTLWEVRGKDIGHVEFTKITSEMRNNKFDDLGKTSLTLEKMIAQRDEVSKLIKKEFQG